MISIHFIEDINFMRKQFLNLALPISMVFSGPAFADSFLLTSTDLHQGKPMSSAHEFQGFGCNGGNLSPQLSWSGAPKETEAFAVVAYDPDAPTGSGWWHWQMVNIPKKINSLPTGAGDPQKGKAPAGSISTKNDYGIPGFGGACPPKGHGPHRYQFTVHALSKKLEIPDGASGALTGYMVRAHSIASSTIEATYERD